MKFLVLAVAVVFASVTGTVSVAQHRDHEWRQWQRGGFYHDRYGYRLRDEREFDPFHQTPNYRYRGRWRERGVECSFPLNLITGCK